jgi:hypothetical protein
VNKQLTPIFNFAYDLSLAHQQTPVHDLFSQKGQYRITGLWTSLMNARLTSTLNFAYEQTIVPQVNVEGIVCSERHFWNYSTFCAWPRVSEPVWTLHDNKHMKLTRFWYTSASQGKLRYPPLMVNRLIGAGNLYHCGCHHIGQRKTLEACELMCL